MKKIIKKSVSLLIAGAMVILPVSMSTQAKEIPNNTSSVLSNKNSCTSSATIVGSNVRLREKANLGAKVLLYLQNGYSVKVDKNGYTRSEDGTWWYPCVYKNTFGYVAAQYVHLIPGT